MQCKIKYMQNQKTRIQMKSCTNMQPPVSVSWFFNKDLPIPFVFVLTPYKLCLCSGPQQCSSYVYVLSGSCGEPISSHHAITFLPHSSRSLFNLGGRSRSSTRKNAMARGWDFSPGTVRRSAGGKTQWHQTASGEIRPKERSPFRSPFTAPAHNSAGGE